MRRAEALGLAAMALGALLWVAAVPYGSLGYDANAYVAMGHGWARTGSLVMEWGDVLTFGPSDAQPSHHFPPAYPLYLGLVFKLAGYGLAQAKLAALAMSLAMLAVVYGTTRDLYGRERAALVAGLVALTPQVLWVSAMGFSENLALLLFTLTMWAILRSLRDERFIVLGGLFAGLAYLARSSMGAFFLLAGLAGLAWRLAHRGPRGVAGSAWYPIGVAVFAAVVGLWAWRNVDLFGWPNWETSPGTRTIPAWIRDHPREYAHALLVRAPLLAAVGAPFALALGNEARASLRGLRDERVSGLWLSVGLVWTIGLVFSAAYASMGLTRMEAMRLDNMRYVLVGIVPLLWALVEHVDLDDRRAGRRLVALGVVLMVGCAAVFAFPARYLPAEVGAELDPHLRPGDDVAIAGAGKYAFYASLSDPASVDVYNLRHAPPDARPEFILALHPLEKDGYRALVDARMGHPLWGSEEQALVLVRDDVAVARGIP